MKQADKTIPHIDSALLPAEDIYLIECIESSESDLIEMGGALIASIASKVDLNNRVERRTNRPIEVQAKGRSLATATCCGLYLKPERLIDRIAYQIFVSGSVELQDAIQALEAALNDAPPDRVRGALEQILMQNQLACSPSDLIEQIEELIAHELKEIKVSAPQYTKDSAALVAGYLEEVKPALKGMVANWLRGVLSGLADKAQQSPRAMAERVVATDQFITDWANACAERSAVDRQKEGQLRSDLRLRSRQPESPLKPDATPQGFLAKLTSRVAGWFEVFLKDDRAAILTGPSAEPSDMVGDAVQAGVKARALTEVSQLILAKRDEVNRRRLQLQTFVKCGRELLLRGDQWRSRFSADTIRLTGISLEEDERVIKELTENIELPEPGLILSDPKNGSYLDVAQVVNSRESEARRRAVSLYQTATLESVFARLSRELQDSLISELAGHLTVPARKVSTARWAEVRVLATPSGPQGPIGRALERQSFGSRYHITEAAETPNRATAQLFVPYIKPSELQAYFEGKEAIERLKQGGDELLWKMVFPRPSLALEPDPDTDGSQIEELVVKGLVTRIIGASKVPAKGPYYLVNGHAGGRAVHELPPALKRDLPKLGNTTLEMKRTLARNPIYREEIEHTWGARLTERGKSAMISEIEKALATDIISTAGLRGAASRVMRQLAMGGQYV